MRLRKSKLPAVLLAAAIAVSSMGLAGCGDNDKKNDSSSELGAGEYTEDESRDIEQAKEIITNWYKLMNEAKYSEAIRLMTPGYAELLGYDALIDGESSGKVDFEISEDGALLSSDNDGNIIVGLSITEIIDDDEKNKKETMMYVTFYEGSGFISSGANFEPVPTKTYSNKPDLSEVAEDAAYAAYAAAEQLLADLQVTGEPLPEDGSYTSGDGSAISEAVDKAAADTAKGTELSCTITIEKGKTAYAKATATLESLSVTAAYPSDAETSQNAIE